MAFVVDIFALHVGQYTPSRKNAIARSLESNCLRQAFERILVVHFLEDVSSWPLLRN